MIESLKLLWNFLILSLIFIITMITLLPNIIFNAIYWMLFRHDIRTYFDTLGLVATSMIDDDENINAPFFDTNSD